jgi:hypothetical protein
MIINFSYCKFQFKVLTLLFSLIYFNNLNAQTTAKTGKRVGIIGLDTSHSLEFIRTLNSETASPDLKEYKIVAAYPKGSNDIKSSVDRIPKYTEQAKKHGVEIVNSIDELISKSDVICLETNDGRLHLEQASKVIAAKKTLFIDKPVAASLSDVLKIVNLAKKNNVPIFSSSSLRYVEEAQEIRNGSLGRILGADTFTPAVLEKTHPDLYWYGMHGVEMLYTVMGTGCKTVSRIYNDSTDVVVGTWADQRVGVFRGTRTGKHTYGGTVYGEKGNKPYGGYKSGYALIEKIVEFFETKIPPVDINETIEIYTFLEAAEESKKKNGTPVNLEKVLKKAEKKANK